MTPLYHKRQCRQTRTGKSAREERPGARPPLRPSPHAAQPSPASVSRLLRRTLDAGLSFAAQAGGVADGSFLTRPPPVYRSRQRCPPWRRCAAAPLTPPGRPFTARSSHAAGRYSIQPDQQQPCTQPAPIPATDPAKAAGLFCDDNARAMPVRRPPASPEPTQPDRRADEGETPSSTPHQATATRRCRAVPGR